MSRVYICSPYSGEVEKNIEVARKVCEEIHSYNMSNWLHRISTRTREGSMDVLQGFSDLEKARRDYYTPVAPHILFPNFMSETDSGVGREEAMFYCLSLLQSCDLLLVVTDNLTRGMKDEVAFASRNGIKVEFLSSFLPTKNLTGKL